MTTNRCYFALVAQLRYRNISRSTKIKLYKMILEPVLLYVSEIWTLTKGDMALLGRFERKVLRKIYGTMFEDNAWKIRYNYELYQLDNKSDIITTVKVSRMRLLGRMIDGESVKELMLKVFMG